MPARTPAVTAPGGSTAKVPGGKPAAFFFSAGCGERAGGATSLHRAAQMSGNKARTARALTGAFRRPGPGMRAAAAAGRAAAPGRQRAAARRGNRPQAR
jgi:hypothetical protein